jgi:hypothetical protein
MKDEQSNIEVSAEAAHNGNLAPLKERKYRQMGKKDQTILAAMPQRDKNIGSILIRNYICCKNICARF